MFRSIVVGTDGSSTSRAAVAHASQLARRCGARVHLVSAFKLASQAAMAAPAEAALVMAGVTSDEEVQAAVDELLGALAKELEQEGVAVTTYACPRSPAQALLEVAEQQGADLIVVGSRGMQGPRRILGSVPNHVAHHAGCSVLIVSTG